MTDASRAAQPAPSLLWINQFAVLPSDGGGTRHFELGRELVRRGWRVTLFASDFHMHRRAYTRRRDAAARQPVIESVEGVDVHWLWAAGYDRNNWRRGHNWLSFARSVRRAAAALSRPDIVIGSSPQLFAARAAQRVARQHRTRFVLEVRDLWPESLIAAGGRRGLAYYVMDHVASRLYRSAERIIVLAEGTGTYLARKGVPRGKLMHIPNGVDIELFDAAGPPASGNGSLTLVYAGAHGPANGLEALLDAAHELLSDTRLRFVLVGDGPAKASLMTMAAQRDLTNVEFVDPVPKATLVSMLRRADAGLMLLRDAPLFSFAVSPNKLFDYTAAGLPVVCNVPGEVAAMLAAAGGGIQATDASGGALANAIRRLRNLSELERRSMGLAGRRWVEREHSRKVLGARLDRALRETIAS